VDTALNDQIPTFEKGDKAVQEVGLSNWSALTSGPGIRTWLEVAAIALVAVVIVGGAELLLRLLEVPQYILPTPSLILMGLISDFRFIAPHTLITLKELLVGFAAGASVGFVLAAVITQFPFVEKIITPYIIRSSPRRCWRWCRSSSCASASAPSRATLRSLSPSARW